MSSGSEHEKEKVPSESSQKDGEVKTRSPDIEHVEDFDVYTYHERSAGRLIVDPEYVIWFRSTLSRRS
jgi:hypothetical protein